ncbi:hypothetical protein GCM10010176_102980 [Nonomuraea spiralis]|nr:hypothetical protein GCM10010176_102980 [Nonomuraea spiralis]
MFEDGLGCGVVGGAGQRQEPARPALRECPPRPDRFNGDMVKRRHSANDGVPPVTFERLMIKKRQASTVLLRAAVA